MVEIEHIMSDPAWFPSAAMQTLGAMYAIFVAVYVLALKDPTLRKKLSRELIDWFGKLSFLVVGSIGVNAFVLYTLSAGDSPLEFYTISAILICFVLFMITIAAIAWYSSSLVESIFLIKGEG